jgi:hypothetical protein
MAARFTASQLGPASTKSLQPGGPPLNAAIHAASREDTSGHDREGGSGCRAGQELPAIQVG